MICKKCNSRPVDYDSPDFWCVVCWADWWFLSDLDDHPPEIINELKEERIEFLRENGNFSVN